MIRTALALALVLMPLGGRAAEEHGNKAVEKPEKQAGRKAETKPEDRHLAVTGVTVHTVTGPTIEEATVLSTNGKIAAMGSHVKIPRGAETIEAEGYHLYPGLVAVSPTFNFVGSGNPADSTDVFSLGMTLGLAGGLTTVNAGNTAAKLTQGSVDGIVLKTNLLETLNYSARDPASKRRFRDALERVRGYLRDLEQYEREKGKNPETKKPDDKWIRGDYQKALQLLKGEVVGTVSADSTRELRDICSLAGHYGFRLVIQGAREGWTLPGEMARAGVSAVVTPRDRVDPSEETNRETGATIENARILHEHGVPIAISAGRYISTSGMAGRDLQHLPMEAAYAVRGGLPDEEAVKAITINAARILGVDDRVGSIEIGKDADFIIVDGDLLHYQTHVRWTIVNGRVAYDRLKDTLFDHLPSPLEENIEPPVDHWPRSLGEDW